MSETSNLLINEPPLQVLPTLAARVGLNEAIFLQQLHYWLVRSQNEQGGRKWVYNTYEEWQRDNFPFWSIATLKRIVAGLEGSGLVLSGEYNHLPTDRTKWYTIDYAELNKLTGA